MTWDEVRAFFASGSGSCREAGIAPERVALDPGIGFGKTPGTTCNCCAGWRELRVAGRPLVAGVSRKSLIAHLLGDPGMDKRRWPTVALTAWLREAGADVLRVHDVKENVEALRMIEAITGREIRHPSQIAFAQMRPSNVALRHGCGSSFQWTGAAASRSRFSRSCCITATASSAPRAVPASSPDC